MIDKWVLVDYIKTQSLKQKQTEVTAIKIQKSLYFLYAMWAGYSHQTKGEVQFPESERELFEPNFIAWAYGAVDIEVYEAFKLNPKVTNTQSKEMLKKQATPAQLSFIQSTLPRILNTSDFGLVDLNHRDNCWKNNYVPNPNEKGYISHPIPKEQIIAEYTMNFGKDKN